MSELLSNYESNAAYYIGIAGMIYIFIMIIRSSKKVKSLKSEIETLKNEL